MNAPSALAAVALLCLTAPLLAERPLLTDDPEPVPQGKFEIEIGADYQRNGHEQLLEAPLTLSYGVCPGLEVGIEFGGRFGSSQDDTGETLREESVSDLSLSAKYEFLDQEKYFFSQALAATLKIPIADHDKDLGSGKPDYDITWILERQINENFAVLLNVGYTWVGQRHEEEPSDVFHYSVAATYQLTDKLQPVAEILFETPAQRGRTSIGANAGIRWILTDYLTLDAAVGTRLAGDWPDFTTTFGMTLAF